MSVPTPAERTASELFLAYRSGWRDGAINKVGDKKFVDHALRRDISLAYVEGYKQGQQDAHVAITMAAKRYGYRPSILRGKPKP